MKTNINGLIDLLIEVLELKNDAALALMLGVSRPVVSHWRHGRVPFGATHILRAHDVSELPIARIKSFLTPVVA